MLCNPRLWKTEFRCILLLIVVNLIVFTWKSISHVYRLFNKREISILYLAACIRLDEKRNFGTLFPHIHYLLKPHTTQPPLGPWWPILAVSSSKLCHINN